MTRVGVRKAHQTNPGLAVLLLQRDHLFPVDCHMPGLHDHFCSGQTPTATNCHLKKKHADLTDTEGTEKKPLYMLTHKKIRQCRIICSLSIVDDSLVNTRLSPAPV